MSLSRIVRQVGLTCVTCALLSLSTLSLAYTLPEGPGYSHQRPEDMLPSEQKLQPQRPTYTIDTLKVTEETRKLAFISPLILLYGGENYKTFLGCLNCAPTNYISLWNPKGPFGDNRSPFSIWNQKAEFGCPLSSMSPWGRYGGHPPLVINTRGDFYGFLTTNAHHTERFNHNFALTLYSYSSLISQDVEGWFYKIFPHYDVMSYPVVSNRLLNKIPRPKDTKSIQEQRRYR